MYQRNQELLKKMVEYYHGDPKRVHHFMKVYAFASLIGESEELNKEDLEVLCAAAIVHDIGIKEAEARYGYNNGKLQEELGPELARNLLHDSGYDPEETERICYLVGHHHTYKNINSVEYQILVEADFLVNAYEDELKQEAIQKFCEQVFVTTSGKQLLDELYLS